MRCWVGGGCCSEKGLPEPQGWFSGSGREILLESVWFPANPSALTLAPLSGKKQFGASPKQDIQFMIFSLLVKKSSYRRAVSRMAHVEIAPLSGHVLTSQVSSKPDRGVGGPEGKSRRWFCKGTHCPTTDTKFELLGVSGEPSKVLKEESYITHVLQRLLCKENLRGNRWRHGVQ